MSIYQKDLCNLFITARSILATDEKADPRISHPDGWTLLIQGAPGFGEISAHLPFSSHLHAVVEVKNCRAYVEVSWPGIGQVSAEKAAQLFAEWNHIVVRLQAAVAKFNRAVSGLRPEVFDVAVDGIFEFVKAIRPHLRAERDTAPNAVGVVLGDLKPRE